jgi:MFS transporter, UMF1 family
MSTVVEQEPAAQPSSTRRERVGWYFYAFADHAFYTTLLAVFLGPYLTTIAKNAADSHHDVHPLGITVAATSYYPYLISVSVLLSVFALPIVGSIADRSAHRKRLLGAIAFTGAAITCCFALLPDRGYLLGGLLYILANIGLSAASVVYNSFLSQLVGADLRDATSSRGWATGYVGGGIHLALCLVAVFVVGDQHTMALERGVTVFAGLWWAGFAIIPLMWLRDRPPVAPEPGTGNTWVSGFRQLGATLRHLRAYPLTLLFLLAFLVYNDGIQTVIAVASTYGTDELKLTQSALAATILVVQFVAFGGALLLNRIAARVGARRTILGSLVGWIVVVLAAYGVPAGSPWLFMLLGAAIGIVLGGSQALSRSLFSQLIPAGREAEYFGFYGISDKGSSWLGPLIFGLVNQIVGNYRAAIVSLVVFFIAGFVILLFVPVRRAIVAAGNTPPRVV